ncbi:YidB family protein [Streptomyces sp. NPDC006733]|uniref:YidB family protein n=1 Tax=Streptomyces sp. NPDC006733 TaxID=3155460 RepID=UPI0033E0EE30
MSNFETSEDGGTVQPTTLTISGESLADAGLESQVQSWIGGGRNEPVTADQITLIVGREQLGQAAASLGSDPAELAADLATALPQIIDATTDTARAEDGIPNLVELQIAPKLANVTLTADYDYSAGDRIEQPWGSNVGVRYSW